MFTGMVTFARTGPHPDIHKTMNSLELAAARDALCLSTLFCLDRVALVTFVMFKEPPSVHTLHKPDA